MIPDNQQIGKVVETYADPPLTPLSESNSNTVEFKEIDEFMNKMTDNYTNNIEIFKEKSK